MFSWHHQDREMELFTKVYGELSLRIQQSLRRCNDHSLFPLSLAVFVIYNNWLFWVSCGEVSTTEDTKIPARQSRNQIRNDLPQRRKAAKEKKSDIPNFAP